MAYSFAWRTSVLLLLAIAGTNIIAGESPPVAETRQGAVRGYRDVATDGREFFAFKGIPYAQPPVGKLRFKDPVPAGGWEGTLDGTASPSLCPQIHYTGAVSGAWEEVVGEEDCLILNVFTPKIEEQSETGKLPVMVFIHGGAFIRGGAALYPPHGFMDEDVVLVVMQYRLGTLGFLSTEDEEAPGNFGLKDQSLALLWVQQNIAAFGGDPLKVTLFGESAGAAFVHFHMLIKQSQGLFHRAILQSGTATCPWATAHDPRRTAFVIGQELGCAEASQDTTSQDLIECLREKPVPEVTASYEQFFEFGVLPVMVAPIVDGELVADHPSAIMETGQQSKVDFMAGINRDDGAYLTSMYYASEEMQIQLATNFDDIGPVSLLISKTSEEADPAAVASRVYERYLHSHENISQQPDQLTKMMTDRLFGVSHDKVALDHLRNVAGSDKKVYLYEFHHRGQQSFLDKIAMPFLSDPQVAKKWVSHADDLGYLFPGTPVFKQHEDEVDLQMTRTVIKLWTNFAATGNPTPDASQGFVWEAAEEERLRHLVIQQQPYMRDDQRSMTREFWNSLPLWENNLQRTRKLEGSQDVDDTEEDATNVHAEL